MGVSGTDGSGYGQGERIYSLRRRRSLSSILLGPCQPRMGKVDAIGRRVPRKAKAKAKAKAGHVVPGETQPVGNLRSSASNKKGMWLVGGQHLGRCFFNRKSFLGRMEPGWSQAGARYRAESGSKQKWEMLKMIMAALASVSTAGSAT